MDLGTLITRSTDGDWQAFADLIEQHQSLVFGYAFAMLGDFHQAEDATQEAFVAAYFQLHSLRSTDAFSWWLRGIVRHQCSRILRKQRLDLVSLDYASEISMDTQSLDEHVIERANVADVVAAMNALPQAEREVIALFYVKDLSRRQIAEFLDLPITTVNNRLHGARSKLKRRLLPMAKDAFQANALPNDFSTKVGKLLEIRGPLVDIEFPSGQPPLLSVLSISDEHGTMLDATVAQHLDNGHVRSVLTAGSGGIAPGMRVVTTDGRVEHPLDTATLSQVLELIGSPTQASPRAIIETGIKSIDLFSPYPTSGKAAILGPLGVGKMVIIQEIIHNLRSRGDDVSLFTFIKPGEAEVALLRGISDEAAHLSLSLAQMVVLAAEDPRDLGAHNTSFDAITHMSIERATNHLWPAVDLLRSTSQELTPDVAGAEHIAVATATRELLQQLRALEERIRNGSVYQLSAEDRQVLNRGRRMDRFFTQPFFVAEEYTKRPGSYVTLSDTLRGCMAILTGECDDLPEVAFVFGGSIDEIRAKAATT